MSQDIATHGHHEPVARVRVLIQACAKLKFELINICY